MHGKKRSVMAEYLLWLLKTVTLLVLVLVLVPVMIGTIMVMVQGGKDFSSSEERKVAVVELTGPIMSSKDVVADLYKHAFKDDISGIILRIDSPGGAVGPSQEIYNAVKELKKRKPIIASMASVAASGGLYSALSATKVLANPGTVTGSIGVIMQFPNLAQAADKVGFKMVTIKSGKLKDVGNPFRSMNPEEEAYLNETISAAQDQFVAAVVEGRGIDEDKVRTFADGRILTGLMAKELGIVDQLGGLHDAARLVFEELESPLGEDELPRLVYPTNRLGQFKELLAMAGLGSFLQFASESWGPRFLYQM